jgi:hypothetical protein
MHLIIPKHLISIQGVTLRIRLVLATIGEPNEGPPGVGQAAYAQENVYERRERGENQVWRTTRSLAQLFFLMTNN